MMGGFVGKTMPQVFRIEEKDVNLPVKTKKEYVDESYSTS